MLALLQNLVFVPDKTQDKTRSARRVVTRTTVPCSRALNSQVFTLVSLQSPGLRLIRENRDIDKKTGNIILVSPAFNCA